MTVQLNQTEQIALLYADLYVILSFCFLSLLVSLKLEHYTREREFRNFETIAGLLK